jgi:predicted HTH transcriptional regulator
MATNTITRKQMFQYIAEQLQDDSEVVSFCEREIEKLSKPKANRKAMETRVHVNDFLQTQVEPMTKGEIANAMGLSIQKAGAAIDALVKDGAVVRQDGESKTEKAKFVAVKA